MKHLKLHDRAMWAHLFAAGACLTYIWLISLSPYVSTGLQFTTPLALIISVHLVWIMITQELAQGFANRVLKRSLVTVFATMAIVVLAAAATPQPVRASAGELLGGAATLLICVLAPLLIMGILIFIAYALARIVSLPFKKSDENEDNSTRLFDFGSLGVVFLSLGFASLEGLPIGYSFDKEGHTEAVYAVDVEPTRVWQVMETATSPTFKLPKILNVLPRPAEVTIDEGSTLGAMRQVKMSGREGEGYLTLQVVERTDTRAVFKVLSDTSPFAAWISYKSLTYQVVPTKEGSQLSVSLDYNRVLSPAWFFGPLMQGSAKLAMDVLARDVKTRAEG